MDEQDPILAHTRSKVSLARPLGQLPKMSWNAGAKSRIRTTLGKDRLSQRLRSPPPAAAAAATTSHPTPELELTGRSRSASVSLDEGEVYSTTTDLVPLSQHPASEVFNDSDASASDVVLNLVSGEQSASQQNVLEADTDSRDEGEVDSEDSNERPHSGIDIHMDLDGAGDSEQDCFLPRESKAMEEEHDPMMEYSRSRSNADLVVLKSASPQTLADLSIPDLQEQLRYFYVAKDPRNVILSDPSGHLGNDCPTRNPRKQAGTSTWTIGNRPVTGRPSRYSSQGGLLIKGRAQQSGQMVDHSEDDRDFIRPRIDRAPNRGNINIPSRRGGRRPDLDHYSGTGRNGSGGYDTYKPPLPKEIPPPPKAERRAPQGSDVYRPMPSAAQNAWKKRRT
ncbi:hypothetical protein MMC13_000082 [Lambiella insularis]|nr:hypothetical protein [Lambiella insularis]